MNIITNIFNNNLLVILISGALIAAASSLLGIFLISRRMALVSDALSHVALPGVGLAYILQFDIFFGVLIALIPVLLFLNFLEQKVRVDFSTLIGIIFAFSLAIGVFLLPGEELLKGLFGDISTVSKKDLLTAGILAALIILFIVRYYRDLLLISFSEEWAKIKNININLINIIFYMALAFTIALGIKMIGALLVSSLLIIPASSAINLAKNSKEMIILSVILGVLGMATGLYFSYSIASITSFAGPVIIVAETIIFGVTFGLKRFRKM